MELSATEMRGLVPEKWNMETTCGVIASIVETDEVNHFTVTELFNNKLSKNVRSDLENCMKQSFPDAVIKFAA